MHVKLPKTRTLKTTHSLEQNNMHHGSCSHVLCNEKDNTYHAS